VLELELVTEVAADEEVVEDESVAEGLVDDVVADDDPVVEAVSELASEGITGAPYVGCAVLLQATPAAVAAAAAAKSALRDIPRPRMGVDVDAEDACAPQKGQTPSLVLMCRAHAGQGRSFIGGTPPAELNPRRPGRPANYGESVSEPASSETS
jgi:hypothetical protein